MIENKHIGNVIVPGDGPVAEPAPASPQPEPIHPVPRPLSPIAARRWLGFPAALSPLVGREREIDTLCELLRDPRRRLITVTGPGGVGKTRLAIEAAERVVDAFPDGAAFIPLASISDPALVLSTIAQVLDVQDVPSRPLLEALVAALQPRRLLLVLDNVEHLAGETVTADIAALLQGCPRLTILATSRALLGLHDEHRFTTPPLALPGPADVRSPEALGSFGAIALFVARAQAVDRDFSLDATNAPVLTEICRRLDGLPLAIELAAAWVRVLSPAALLERLEPRLPLLKGGGADRPPRLRAMHDAIAWSHALLTPDEQRLFRRLAIFTGGFTLEAAERVSRGADGDQPFTDDSRLTTHDSPSPNTLDLIAGLIDKCLLQRVDPVGPEPRFAMLETVREFALERLAERGETAAIEAERAAAIRALIARVEPELLGPNEAQWQNLLDAELGNLRATLTWVLEHDPAMAREIGAALWAYWAWRHLAEGRRWLTHALARPAPANGIARASALTTAAALASLEGDLRAAADLAGEALTVLLDRDPLGEAKARWILAISDFLGGEVDVGIDHLDRSLALFDAATMPADRTWAAYARSIRGAFSCLAGDVDQGLDFYEEALSRARASGSQGVTLIILSDYAGWLLDAGDSIRARAMLDEALTYAPGHRGRWLVGTTLIGLALADALESDAATAARRLGAVEALRTSTGMAIPPNYLDRIERASAIAAGALGERGYAAEWAAGHADPDAVIAAALAASDAPSTAGGAASLERFGLSRREREVLALLSDGYSDREIARALYISARTVGTHVSAILRKLDAGSRAEAAVRAVRLGLV